MEKKKMTPTAQHDEDWAEKLVREYFSEAEFHPEVISRWIDSLAPFLRQHCAPKAALDVAVACIEGLQNDAKNSGEGGLTHSTIKAHATYALNKIKTIAGR